MYPNPIFNFQGISFGFVSESLDLPYKHTKTRMRKSYGLVLILELLHIPKQKYCVFSHGKNCKPKHLPDTTGHDSLFNEDVEAEFDESLDLW